jgi:hypothetical protein
MFTKEEQEAITNSIGFPAELTQRRFEQQFSLKFYRFELTTNVHGVTFSKYVDIPESRMSPRILEVVARHLVEGINYMIMAREFANVWQPKEYEACLEN